MRAKAASGFAVGSARLGYLAVSAESGMRAVPDPATAPLLAEAFGMAARGTSLREIAAWLRSGGIRGKRGGPVSLATVQRTLTDPHCCGLSKNLAGEWGRVSHEAVVSRELFDAVQKKLDSKRCCPLRTGAEFPAQDGLPERRTA